MKENLQITYQRDGDARTLTAVYEGRGAKDDIDEFVLETIMKSEIPNLVSLQPLIKDVTRGSPATKALSNQELQVHHKISTLTYEMAGQKFTITT